MSMTDPIADMLTRIRNACMAGKDKVEIPSSKVKAEIARILKEEGFIAGYKVLKDGRQGILKITLRYHEGEPVILGLRRVSKPGRRIYKPVEELKPVRSGFGVAIVSTSKGVMTDEAARRNRVGGEVLCEVW